MPLYWASVEIFGPFIQCKVISHWLIRSQEKQDYLNPMCGLVKELRKKIIVFLCQTGGSDRLKELISDFTVLSNIDIRSIAWRVQEDQEYSLERDRDELTQLNQIKPLFWKEMNAWACDDSLCTLCFIKALRQGEERIRFLCSGWILFLFTSPNVAYTWMEQIYMKGLIKKKKEVVVNLRSREKYMSIRFKIM